MSNILRVGIVGVGQRGLQHLKALWQTPEAKVTALCDPFPENLDATKIGQFVSGYIPGGIHACTDFAQLMDSDLCDAIYFCIPPGRHAGEVLAAAAAGKHLLIEKPVSLCLDEAIAMDRAIQRNGVVATVGFQQRHDSWHQTIREFLADKRLVMITTVANGDLESHSVKHTPTDTLGGPSNRVWAANLAWSGSTVVEAGIHQLDLMRFWAGDVAWTEARYIHRDAEDIQDGGDNPYAYSVTFGFDCGLVANLIITRLRRTFWSDSYQDVVWDHGHLKIEADGPVAYYYDGTYPPTSAIDEDRLRHPLSSGSRNDSTLEINRVFVEAALRSDEESLLNTFSSSMNSLAAVLAANISDQLNGRRIKLSDLLSNSEYADFRAQTRG